MTEPIENIEQLTDTERLAVALFGFTHFPDNMGNRLWRSPDGMLFGIPSTAPRLTGQWPDFTHERLQYYWRIRMEDALAERGLGHKYADALVADASGLCYVNELDRVAAPCLRATTAQRVAAALRCLDGEGL